MLRSWKLLALMLLDPACGGGGSSGSGGTGSISAVSYSDPGIETFPNEGNTHVPVGTVITYNTDPPTSGNHYPDPQPGGFYTELILSGFLVHSMEHGAVIIYYDANYVAQSDLDSLRALANLHLGIQAQICCVPR